MKTLFKAYKANAEWSCFAYVYACDEMTTSTSKKYVQNCILILQVVYSYVFIASEFS